jgi:hypothetical protein
MKTMIGRQILVAASYAAMFLGGATIASAGSTNIQFTDLTITNGVGSNVVTTVALNGMPDPGLFSAQVAFANVPGEFKLIGTSQSVDLHFNPQINIFATGALYLGEATSWTVSPSLIPPGEVITDVSLSLSSSNFAHGSGVFAGTITINSAAVPEPSSMIMASTAVIALGVLRALRARKLSV